MIVKKIITVTNSSVNSLNQARTGPPGNRDGRQRVQQLAIVGTVLL